VVERTIFAAPSIATEANEEAEWNEKYNNPEETYSGVRLVPD
jgi:hypothetical protein